MTEFQSHEPEFDYLKSFEIEEKINKVRWVNHPSQSRMILSTNDKTIKLWKVSMLVRQSTCFGHRLSQCMLCSKW